MGQSAPAVGKESRPLASLGENLFSSFLLPFAKGGDCVEIIRAEQGSPLWDRLISYAACCSWKEPGQHLAQLLRENRLEGWASVFAALEEGQIVGFCTLLKTDYYPENRYFPWISTIFVEEPFRGRRISHRMIEAAAAYAKSVGFARVYIPSDMTGFYEKCGFQKIDELENYGGDRDNIFAKEI